jgi:hypothetical protein
MANESPLPPTVFKGFRLPVILVNKLAEAAKLKGTDVSDVVRAILQMHVDAFLRDARRVHIERLQDVIRTVESEPELAPIFKRCKDEDVLMLPMDRGLSREHINQLVEAVHAHAELKRAKKDTAATHENQTHAQDTNAVLVAYFVQLLRRLMPTSKKGRVAKVERLIRDRQLKITEQGDNIGLQLDQETANALQSKARAPAGVVELRRLIDRGVLQEKRDDTSNLVLLCKDHNQERSTGHDRPRAGEKRQATRS